MKGRVLMDRDYLVKLIDTVHVFDRYVTMTGFAMCDIFCLPDNNFEVATVNSEESCNLFPFPFSFDEQMCEIGGWTDAIIYRCLEFVEMDYPERIEVPIPERHDEEEYKVWASDLKVYTELFQQAFHEKGNELVAVMNEADDETYNLIFGCESVTKSYPFDYGLAEQIEKIDPWCEWMINKCQSIMDGEAVC